MSRKIRIPGPVLGLAAVLIVFGVLLAQNNDLGRFFSLGNLQGLLHGRVVTGIAALGMLLIIISGGIDLSVGSVVALVTVVTMQVFRAVDARGGSMLQASITAVVAGVGAGGLCGLCNGLVITRLRVPPFVATLGMWSIARGLAYWLSGRVVRSFPGERPKWVDQLATSLSDEFLFSPGVWGLGLLSVLVALLLRYTVFGRYCYAIGSNEATARLCGVAVDRQKVYVYVLAGLLTGLAGAIQFAQSTSGDPGAGKQLELDVIAAVVIGGASLSGGQGSVSGTLLGVLVLGVLENGVTSLGVPIDVKFILIGVIIIVNTALSRWQQRER